MNVALPDVKVMHDSISVSPSSHSPSSSNTSINELCDGNLEVLIEKRGGTQFGLHGHLYTRKTPLFGNVLIAIATNPEAVVDLKLF